MARKIDSFLRNVTRNREAIEAEKNFEEKEKETGNRKLETGNSKKRE